MIIDFHAHIWGGRYEEDKKEIIKACQIYNISKVFVTGLYSQYPDEIEIEELNREVEKFINEYPDLIGGLCYINPSNKNSLEVLKKGIEEQNMEGMKLWIATYCDDPAVFPLVEQCIDYNVPVLIHSFHKAVQQLPNESVSTHVANLAMLYPELKIVMAHLGANAYHSIKVIQGYPNVWVDISGSLFRRDEIDYVKEHIGANRIVFGSDLPGASYLINLGQVEEAELTQQEKESIYYKNALAILDRNWRV